MTTIGLVANDQLLAVTLNPKVSSGNQKTVTVHIDFSDEWDGFGKSAVFFTSLANTVYEKVITNGECVVPAEVLKQPCNLYIGVRGVNSDINGIKTTSLVKYKVVEGSPSGTGTEIEPTADVYQQLMTAVNEAITLVENLKKDVNTLTSQTVTLEQDVNTLTSQTVLLEKEITKQDFITKENFDVYSDGQRIFVRKVGRQVTLDGTLKLIKKFTNPTVSTLDGINVFSIPNEFRPIQAVRQVCQGSMTCAFFFYLDENGLVNFSRYRDENGTIEPDKDSWFPFHTSYISAE